MSFERNKHRTNRFVPGAVDAHPLATPDIRMNIAAQRSGRNVFMAVLKSVTGFIRPVTIRSIVAGFTIAIATSAGAHAAGRDDAPPAVGNWLTTASSDGRGCFLTREYDRPGGTTLLLGLDVDGTNRLTVLNENWSIRPKDRLRLDFRLSNASFPGHFAVGIASGANRGFVTSFGAKFPTIFATARTVQIFRGDVPVERLTLDGSGAAVAALRACVAKQRGAPTVVAGESRPADSIPKDPFAADARRERKK